MTIENQALPDVDDFLTEFGAKCVEFGYYCDQYMRQEINLGEITRRLSEATADAEGFYANHGTRMRPEQDQRYKVMQITLDAMTTTLIETEIKRNKEIIEEALRKGEYFIVNITYNSINSSLYMVYNHDNEKQRAERDHKQALLQQEQELTQGLMKVMKAVEGRTHPEVANDIEFKKLQKAFEIYVEYFKHVEKTTTKRACDTRVLILFREHIAYLQGKDYFANRKLCFQHVSICYNILWNIADQAQRDELDQLKEEVRPPDPATLLRRLYQDVLQAEGEANVYSAVVAFNNFAEMHPSESRIGEYKRHIRQVLMEKGYS